MKIHLRIKYVYGRPLFYGECDVSKMLLEFMDHKSFTEDQVRRMSKTRFEPIIYARTGFNEVSLDETLS